MSSTITSHREPTSHRRQLAALTADSAGSPLKREVCSYVLDHYETDSDIESFFNDLARHGCVSGMVSILVYYADTHAFFDRHYGEIEELRIETEEAFGEPLRIERDLKNTLAWLAFEETALRMARDQLQLEL